MQLDVIGSSNFLLVKPYVHYMCEGSHNLIATIISWALATQKPN